MWRFDGVSAVPVAAINESSPIGSVMYYSPFKVFDGRLFYTHRAFQVPYQLWGYDGSKAQKIMDLSPPLSPDYDFDFGVYKGALYFGVVAMIPGSDVLRQNELWCYDGKTPPKKVGMLTDLESGDSGFTHTQPCDFQVYKGWLYFGSNRHLYRCNGPVLEDLVASSAGAPRYFLALQEFFQSCDELLATL